MRFMVMHKVDAKMEAGELPSKDFIAKMGTFIHGYAQRGALLDGAGLHRSAARARVTVSSGAPAIVRGPYDGSNELLAQFALIHTTSLEQAIALATELGKAAGGREIEVGPVVETWDLHDGKRPADAPHRFLLLVKADAASEAGSPPPAAVTALLEQWKRDGVLQSSTVLKPSKTAKRTKVVDGKRQWFDGPFTESKELIAGFAILELPSVEEAQKMTEDYVALLGDNECDIRELA